MPESAADNALLCTPDNVILHHYLVDALTIQQIAGLLRLTIPQILQVIRSADNQRIIRELEEAEHQRHKLLRAIAVTRALHTLTALTDPEACGTDRFLETQRRACTTLLRDAASSKLLDAVATSSRRPRPSPEQPTPRQTRPAHRIAASHNPTPSPHASRSTMRPARPSGRPQKLAPRAIDTNTKAQHRSHPRRSRKHDTLVRRSGKPSIASTRPRDHPGAAGHRRAALQPTFNQRRVTLRARYRRRSQRPKDSALQRRLARSPPKHGGKGRKTRMFEKFGFFRPLCWHRSIPEACSVWSGRIARSRGIGSCCAAPRTWSAFSKGREVRCEECSPDLGRSCCVRARWRSSG